MTEEPPRRDGAPERSDPGTSLSSPVGRRFGDAEISRILQTAADLQERSYRVGLDPTRGPTLDELRQVALEAGIDPRFIDLAVSDGDAPVERQENVLAGGPVSWRFHAEVEGDISDDDRSRILQAIRSVMGKKGELEDVYGRMEWSLDDGLGPVIIGISNRDGKIHIDVSSSRSGEAGLIHGLLVPFGGVFGGAAASALLGISGPAVLPVLAVTGGVLFAGTRLGWRMRSAWWERRLRKLIERISSIVQEVAALPPGGEASE